MKTIAKLRELEAFAKTGKLWHPEAFERAMVRAAPALLAIAEAAGKISRMVGAGQGPAQLVTAGECKELWDALAQLEEVEL